MRSRAAALLVTATLLGCAGDEQAAAPPKPPPPVVVTVAPRAAPAPLAVEVLADGTVEDEEMRLVLEATMACIRDAGFDATVDSFDGGDGWSVTYGDGSDEAVARCEAELLHHVDVVYSEQHGPSDEEIARRDRATVDCLRALGHALPPDASVQEAMRVANPFDFAGCADG